MIRITANAVASRLDGIYVGPHIDVFFKPVIDLYCNMMYTMDNGSTFQVYTSPVHMVRSVDHQLMYVKGRAQFQYLFSCRVKLVKGAELKNVAVSHKRCIISHKLEIVYPPK